MLSMSIHTNVDVYMHHFESVFPSPLEFRQPETHPNSFHLSSSLFFEFSRWEWQDHAIRIDLGNTYSCRWLRPQDHSISSCLHWYREFGRWSSIKPGHDKPYKLHLWWVSFFTYTDVVVLPFLISSTMPLRPSNFSFLQLILFFGFWFSITLIIYTLRLISWNWKLDTDMAPADKRLMNTA